MVLRKCNICDRKFKKTEHYKRHERSHTKERPYECTVCHKKFSRSDVLSRHAKGHVQNANGPTSINAAKNTTATQSIPPTTTTDATDSGTANNRAHVPVFPPTPRDVQITPPGGLSSNLDFLADISAHQSRTEPEINAMMMDEQQQSYFGWGDISALDSVEQQQQAQRPITFDAMPSEMLQLWLEPRADSVSHHSSSIDFMRNMNLMGENFMSSGRRTSRSMEPNKAVDDIPNERFARVERSWVAPTNLVGRLINSLWHDASCYDSDNLFSIPPWQSMSPSTGNYPGSRFGLDEECRLQLQHAFGLSPAPLSSVDSVIPNDAALSPTASTTGSGSIPSFPPAEILDMALDLYFRHFHPLVPFVHVPTFCAKKTKLPLLFVMCQIGMIMLGTKGTTSFVSKTFACSLERISLELAKCAIGNETSTGVISTFAAALLMLNLAAMTGEKSHLQQSQMLYINLISIAQRHGLFTAGEGQSLDMSLFEAVPDLEMRWKAWSRVDLIVGLLLLDSWFSSFLSTSPIIVPDSVQIVLPCHESLFEANCSSRWMQHIRGGKRIITSMVKSPSETTALPALDVPVDEFCMHGVLAMLQLRLSEAYHRILFKRPSYPFAPCHSYAMDSRARCLTSLQVQLMNTYHESLSHMNPNCIVMWHHMCMYLTADIQIFDLAAGRNGAAPARKALDDIAAWTQTPAARRACLHAAQIFKEISNRKASDDTMFQSVHALFSAALILGLYIYMVPRSAETQAGATSIELLEDIDWQQVGTEGFAGFMEPQSSNPGSRTIDDQSINFIRHGGTIYVRGVPHQGGYQSARRILLDYGGLLKDTGKWSVRRFSYVLHIMSDVLMDVD
ncbi:C2H2 transcription factor, putative [Talaromyces stipitatus ATCC 10500]|uniref:C2H2 transcription factor, putative n=1 Tax=Talaromyces stipitatus (strain ATCC 10500 / CBS 375.48 / QM 6759 / NRRL 1006) TaxID=441959 RepID=B8MGI5_TALSN|nr:C2H2 transcription factor, putative [Talaromyces stipitatus ATCC 10500]EED16736.1 C2H2 transcription factor, putative [Talaromyces stipitatus ATCC 10500]